MGVVEQKRPFGEGCAPVMLIHLGIDVAIDHHDVFPAIVVVVDKAVAPADKRNGHFCDPCLVGDFGKAAFPIVVVERLVVVGEIGDQQVDQAVVHVVAYGQAHGCDLAALVVQRKAGDIALIFKRAVALINVEVVGLGVVGHQQIDFAVVIYIHKDRSESVVGVLVGDAGFLANVCKGSVAIVVEEMIRLALQTVRAAHYGRSV